MGAPTRLGLYALALVLAFATTFGVARAVVPAEVAQDWAAVLDGHSEEETGHDDAATGSADAGHGDAGHESEPGGAAPAGRQVPGLAAEQDGYRLSRLSAPGEVGSEGELSFTLTGPDGGPVRDYEVSHQKELHLIVVRSDGEGFRHVHPELDEDGVWSIDWQWQQAGSHRVYADFVPAATGEELTLTSTLDVAGELTPVAARADSNRAEVAGYTVTLDGALAAGAESELGFTVTRGGEPVTVLQPYLGSYGHLVALRAGDLGYLHVHPMGAEPTDDTTTSGPGVDFMAEAPSPGRYLLYLDFQVDGQVHTAEFTLTAP